MARILVVEDEVLIADLLQEYLEELGHVVVGPAFSLADALALIDQHKLDCAILDVTLGRDSSFEAAAALASRNVPFAFATGRAGSSVPERFSDRPVVYKPYLYDDIRDLASQLCPVTAA